MEYKTENRTYNRDVREMYDRFMVFELLDTGERQRLNITEDEFKKSKGAGILHPKQVAIIVKEDYRRIFLVQIGHLHRCKVVTVEQGDETKEFLRVFGFDLEELAKASGFTGEVITNVPKITKQPPTTSPIFKAKMQSPKKSLPQDKAPRAIQNDTESAKDKLDDILNIELPKNYKRKNILTGNNILYGLITKKVEIFGQHIEETAWEPVKNLPNGVFELDGHKLRIHYNEEYGIEAIEILEPIVVKREMIKEKQKFETTTIEEGEIDYNKWTVKDLKAYCTKNDIKVLSSYRKAQIVQLVKDHSV
ncbi:MAG: hypothetical protein ACTSP9_17310 [Promethearchaeota archaeon]